MNKIRALIGYNPVFCCLSSLSEFDQAVEEALNPEK